MQITKVSSPDKQRSTLGHRNASWFYRVQTAGLCIIILMRGVWDWQQGAMAKVQESCKALTKPVNAWGERNEQIWYYGEISSGGLYWLEAVVRERKAPVKTFSTTGCRSLAKKIQHWAIFVQENSQSNGGQMQFTGVKEKFSGNYRSQTMRSNLICIHESHLHFGKWCFNTINLQVLLPFGSKLFSSFTWNLSFPCLVTMSSPLLHKMELPSKNPSLVLEGCPTLHLRRQRELAREILSAPNPITAATENPSPSSSSKGSILGISVKVYWAPILCHTNLLRSPFTFY